MKIVVDARSYFFRSGVGVYTRNVLDSMIKNESGNEITAFFSSHRRISDIPISMSVADVRISRAEWEDPDSLRVFANEVDAADADICLMPFLMNEIHMKTPLAVVIHDIIPIIRPEYFTDAVKRNFTFDNIKKIINSARAVICDSCCTRDDIEKTFDIDADKLKVIHLGVSDLFSPRSVDEIKSTLQKYSLDYKRYVLFSGMIEPRKNVDCLIKAFYQSVYLQSESMKLVIVGKRGWNVDGVYEAAGRGVANGSIVFTEFIPVEDLAALYCGAVLYVYPTSYEGFGLPVLEAMAAGTPVLSSRCSSIPEITGDCACLIEPGDVAVMTEAMDQLMSSPALLAKMARSSLERAGMFSWDETARKTIDIISSCFR